MSIFAEINCDGEYVTVEFTEKGELYFIDYDIDDDIAEEMMGGEVAECLEFANRWEFDSFQMLIWFLVRNEYNDLNINPDILKDILIEVGYFFISVLSDLLLDLSVMYKFEDFESKNVGSEQYKNVLTSLQEIVGMKRCDLISNVGVEYLNYYQDTATNETVTMSVSSFLDTVINVSDHISLGINNREVQSKSGRGSEQFLSQSWNAMAEFASMLGACFRAVPYASLKKRLFSVYRIMQTALSYGYSIEFGYLGIGRIPEVVWQKVKAKQDRVLTGGTVFVIESYINERREQ